MHLVKTSSRPNIPHTVSVDDETVERVATRMGIEGSAELVKEAHAADDKEHNMGFIEAIRAYPKAAVWSLIFSTAIIMEGFDLILINSFYALPAFQRKFGVSIGDGQYVITPAWQSALTNGVQIGSIIGLLLNGYFCDRFGYLRTICVALLCLCGFIFISFFAVNIQMLLVAEILCGLPWGTFQSLTVAYAADVAPIPLRPFLTTAVNLSWVWGQFLSSGVLKGVSTMPETSQWAYRIPFALQWIWPLPIAVCTLFAPESPWYLVRKGRLEDAKRSLRRLASKNSTHAIDVDERVAQMVYTNELEKATTSGQSYFDIFRGANLRRTEIGSVAWVIQNAAGSAFIGYSTVFYKEAGLSTSNAFSMSFGMYALGAIGTMSSWFTMRHFGRRTLYMAGLLSMAVLLFGIGGSGFGHGDSASWAAGSLVIIYAFLYQFTVGPVCYTIVAEIPSTRLRAKSLAVSRLIYNISGIINNIIFPRMMSPIAWNWGRKAGFFWGGSCILCLVWCYFRLPETKGRSYAEIDVLFEDRVPARQFASTKVNLYNKAERVAAGLSGNEDKESKSLASISHVESL